MTELVDMLCAEDYLVELTMVLQSEQVSQMTYNKGSVLQGVMMELIDADYAEILHQNGQHPYSQCTRVDGDENLWIIRTLNKEAFQKILLPMLNDDFNHFYLRHNRADVTIEDKRLKYIKVDDLFEQMLHEKAKGTYMIRFMTPTAFKKNKKICFYPDIRNLYQSLMKRFDSAIPDCQVASEARLEKLTESTEIVNYNLKSMTFGLESNRVQAFLGEITIRIHGSQDMLNFAKFLFGFGNYAGVGIKTAIGMGQINVQ